MSELNKEDSVKQYLIDTLIERVKVLENGLKEIKSIVKKYNSMTGETGCGNHCYNIANETLIKVNPPLQSKLK